MSGAVEYRTDEELSAELSAVFAGEQMLAARRLELISEIDGRDLARRQGATSTVAWLRETLRVSGPVAKQMVTLALALNTTTTAAATGLALGAGAVNEEQASVIIHALTGLAKVTDPEVVGKAEQRLIQDAATFEPLLLRRLANRILELVAPELAEEQLAKQMQQDEARALRERYLTLRPDHHGGTRLSGLLDTEAAAIVNAALDPLCNPARIAATTLSSASGSPTTAATSHTGDSGFDVAVGVIGGAGASSGSLTDQRTPGQRRVDALVEVCRLALHTTDLPDNGGDRAQVVVTINYDDLAQQTGAGLLDNGQTLTPHTVRRMACDAFLIPAVLNTAGQILDLGRERRLFTGPLRRALVLRDGGCAFPACDRPPKWCDGHHIRHWADGGPTCLNNAVLLCGHHHRLLHHSEWIVYIAADGRPEFLPPAYIDPDRIPQRNKYHRRT